MMNHLGHDLIKFLPPIKNVSFLYQNLKFYFLYEQSLNEQNSYQNLSITSSSLKMHVVDELLGYKNKWHENEKFRITVKN